MRRIFSYATALSILLLVGCLTNENSATRNVISIAKAFEDIDFFPEDAGNRAGDFIEFDTLAYHNTIGVILKRRLSKLEIQRIQEMRYKTILSNNDPCAVVINDFLVSDSINVKLIDQKSYVNPECKEDLIAIPNFIHRSISPKPRIFEFGPDSQIYILEFKSNLLVEKIDPNISSMPKQMVHGMVSGIGINWTDSTAVYFVQYW